MATGRFSHRIYVAYSTLYCVGTILSMQISFVGFQPVQSSEHMLVSYVLKIKNIFFMFFFTGARCFWFMPNFGFCRLPAQQVNTSGV